MGEPRENEDVDRSNQRRTRIDFPWEDGAEYQALVEALVAEHSPQGPTEEHLVEELSGVLWRIRRLRLAAAAAHRRGLEEALEPRRDTAKAAVVHIDAIDETVDVAEAVRAITAETEADIHETEEDETTTRRALNLLGSLRNDTYEAALEALRGDTQQWWADILGAAAYDCPLPHVLQAQQHGQGPFELAIEMDFVAAQPFELVRVEGLAECLLASRSPSRTAPKCPRAGRPDKSRCVSSLSAYSTSPTRAVGL